MPVNDLAERKTHYKEFFVSYFEINQCITENQRKQLASKQKELKLSNEEVTILEEEITKNEALRYQTEIIELLGIAKTEKENVKTENSKRLRIEKQEKEKLKIEKEYKEKQMLLHKEQEKKKERQNMIFFTLSWVVILLGGYGVKKYFYPQLEPDILKIEKLQQDSTNNAIARQKGDSLAKIQDSTKKVIENQEQKRLAEIQIKNSLQAKKIKDSLDSIDNIKWQDLMYFSSKGKYGFRDKKTKRVVIPAQYTNVYNFSEGLAPVKKVLCGVL